jgi:biotin transporter BioY
MNNMSMTLVIVIIVLVGFTWLQVFLSFKKNHWYGLIIPMFSLLFSLILFIISLIIYFACRSKLKERTGRANELDRMKIKDM